MERLGLDELQFFHVEVVLPPQHDDTIGLAEIRYMTRREMVPCVQNGRLEREPDPVVHDVDQPAMMTPADPRSVHAPALFLEARRAFDVAGFRDTLELAAHPNRIADVLERL